MTRPTNVQQGPDEAVRKASREGQADRREEYRRYYLPGQLEAARRKVVMLEREAARLGLVL